MLGWRRGGWAFGWEFRRGLEVVVVVVVAKEDLFDWDWDCGVGVEERSPLLSRSSSSSFPSKTVFLPVCVL